MHTVTFKGLEFFSGPDDTLLQAAERAGATIHSECRAGFCGACRCKVKSGDVRQIGQPIAYLPDGYVLACSVKVRSDLVLEDG